MQQGHIHVHTSRVKKVAGQSSVGAAAYQSRQALTHTQQLQFTLGPEHRQALNQGIITDDLRKTLANPDKIPLKDDDRQVKRIPNGITLSEDAIVKKLGRGEWQIKDGDNKLTIKEHRHRPLNKETGKRENTYYLDVYADKTHNYTTREDVLETWMHLPAGGKETPLIHNPPDTFREGVWGSVEAHEINRDAVPAIKVELSYLRDLSREENNVVARSFIRDQFTKHGYLVDASVHRVTASDGKDNTHLHLLVATRPLQADGNFAKDKQSRWNEGLNDPELAHRFRYAWATLQNEALERKGANVRVDPRSYRDQGLDKESGVHVGHKDWQTERRQRENGKAAQTLRGDKNREVQRRNEARAFGTDAAAPRYSKEDIDTYYARRWAYDTQTFEGNFKERAAQQEKQAREQQHSRAEEQRRQDQDRRWQERIRTQTQGKTWRERYQSEPQGRGKHQSRSAGAQGRRWQETVTKPAMHKSWRDQYQSRRNQRSDSETRQRSRKQHFDERIIKQHIRAYGRTVSNKRDQAHFYAVAMQQLNRRQQDARRAPFDRIAGKAGTQRYRAVYQDRPAPAQRGREQERARSQERQRQPPRRSGSGK